MGDDKQVTFSAQYKNREGECSNLRQKLLLGIL